MRRLTRLLAGIALGAVFGLGVASADDSPGGDAFAAWSAVPEAELAGESGGATVLSLNILHQTVTLTGNQTGDSGDISIPGSPFSDAAGIAAVLMNTGNNVAMGNEFIINVYIE